MRAPRLQLGDVFGKRLELDGILENRLGLVVGKPGRGLKRRAGRDEVLLERGRGVVRVLADGREEAVRGGHLFGGRAGAGERMNAGGVIGAARRAARRRLVERADDVVQPRVPDVRGEGLRREARVVHAPGTVRVEVAAEEAPLLKPLVGVFVVVVSVSRGGLLLLRRSRDGGVVRELEAHERHPGAAGGVRGAVAGNARLAQGGAPARRDVRERHRGVEAA